jgi:hypothetical protein
MVDYPKLPPQSKTADGFVPKGWKLESKLQGDLNGDGIADLVFVVRQDNPRNVISNSDGLGVDPLDTNPRILAAAFGTKQNVFTLALQNHQLIPRHESPTIDDPFGGISISKGAFKVSLHYWASAGSWSTSETSFTFRYHNSCFQFVGYDRHETRRNSGEVTDTSVNFLSHKMKTTTGNIEDDHTKINWKPYNGKANICIDTIGDGWEYDPGR